jgi:hypothetical protein
MSKLRSKQQEEEEQALEIEKGPNQKKNHNTVSISMPLGMRKPQHSIYLNAISNEKE